MRIDSISAQNYLNHRSLNIDVGDARVLFCAGPNGCGKTAIAQGIKLAIRGEPVRGLQYKNQLSELITQGEKTGFVSVMLSITDEVGTEFCTTLSDGRHKPDAPFSNNTISLDPAEFFALTPKDRRHMLFAMAGIKLDRVAVREALLDKGHDGVRLDRVVEFLRLGFDAAAENARGAATEARGAWKVVTGETYGEVKAASWEAPKPNGAAVNLNALADAVWQAEKVVAERDEARVKLREASAAWRGAEEATKAKAALKDNEVKLKDAQSKRNGVNDAIEKLKPDAQYRGGQTNPCPACGVVLFWDGDNKLREYDKVKPKTDPKVAHTRLTDLKRDLSECDTLISKLTQAVGAGKSAQHQLANLPAQPKDEDVRKAETEYQAARAALAMAQSEHEQAKHAIDERDLAAKKTAQAREYHNDVLGYTKLAEAIQILPGEYLNKTLTEVNLYLRYVSEHAVFSKLVSIGDDMELRYGTIPYALASSSQQWRMRCAMGYTLAVLSKLYVLVLDEFDVVEPASRGALLKFFAENPGDDNQPVQIVLCATLKERPKVPAPAYRVHWMGA
jgi:hypothetical protein